MNKGNKLKIRFNIMPSFWSFCIFCICLIYAQITFNIDSDKVFLFKYQKYRSLLNFSGAKAFLQMRILSSNLQEFSLKDVFHLSNFETSKLDKK